MRHIITAAALAMLAFTASAQQTATDSVGYRLVSPEHYDFHHHWYVQAQGGIGFTIGEARHPYRLVSPAAAVSVGYQIMPSFGVRVGVSGWESRGSTVSPRYNYKFNYLQGNVDAVLSLTNAICGYKYGRVLDFYGFLGLGVNYAFNNDKAVQIADKGAVLKYLWRDNRTCMAARGGLGVNINLSRVVALNIEGNANMLGDHYNSKRGDNMDWQFNGLIGLTVKFGKTRRAVPAVYEKIEDTYRTMAPAAVTVVTDTVVKVVEKSAEVKMMTQNLFFTINSSVISKAEMAKVGMLAEYMNTNPDVKVTVTGYADEETGSSDYNMTLSENRAKAVAAALGELGIASERIMVNAKGDTVQPFDTEDKNRVVIAVTSR